MAVIAKGSIRFESRTSELLECSCGNTVTKSGFDVVEAACEDLHYKCGRCDAIACVDPTMRIVLNSSMTNEEAGR